MNALPSIHDLARDLRAFGAAHDVLSRAAAAGDGAAKSIGDKAGALWLARWLAMVDLVLTMPATTLQDVAVQLMAALAKLDDLDDDELSPEAKMVCEQLRRALVSTSWITTQLGGVEPGLLGYTHLANIHRSEFPPAMIAPGTANGAQEARASPLPRLTMTMTMTMTTMIWWRWLKTTTRRPAKFDHRRRPARQNCDTSRLTPDVTTRGNISRTPRRRHCPNCARRPRSISARSRCCSEARTKSANPTVWTRSRSPSPGMRSTFLSQPPDP
jgi:hypothetical protein